MAHKDQPVVQLTPIEQEVVVLKAIRELIDSIVNSEVLTLTGSDPVEIRFNSAIHSSFFNLVLVDLLLKTDPKGFVAHAPYLSLLAGITEKPHFNVEGSIDDLRAVTGRFREWLDTAFSLENVWLPSIDTELTLKLRRYDLIKIGGNICRHNFLRAVGIAGDVRKIFLNSGKDITLDQTLLALPELNEWLHANVFQYHSSTIAEYLNDIRWGIYAYLLPEFTRSVVTEGGECWKYHYTYPVGVESAFGKACYWELMNETRSQPYMGRFKVTEWLKKRY